MDGPPLFDEAALEVGWEALLEQQPTALIAAIGADGIFVPIPDSLTRNGHGTLPGRSAMDFVVPEDWERIIEAWERTRTTGAGRAVVRLAAAPHERVVVHYFDARHRHGVYLGVLIGPSARETLAAGVEVDASPPRLARARKNEAAVFVDVDEALSQILGWAADDLVGRRSLELIHPDDQERAIRAWMAMLAAGDNGPRVRLRHRRSDGSWVWLEVTNHNFLDDPSRAFVAAEMIDVSDEVGAQEALRQREELFRRLAEALPSGLVQIDRDGTVVYTNARLEEILGQPPSDAVDAQFGAVVRDDWAAFRAAIAAAVGDGADADLEVQVQRHGDQSLRRCLARVRALTDEGAVTGAIVSLEDVTESAQLQAELERRATIDMLTRCLNRATVMSSLEATLAQGDDGYTAVIFVDLDNFKAVNDRHGHAVGDELLIVVGERLTRAVRHGDFVGRLGGDEFLVVCPDVAGADEAKTITDRIAAAVQGQLRIGGSPIELRASVGVAYAGRREATADALVSAADAAMYAAKRDRRSAH
jgi:diguanylate cyclase (GGDEF)-like protein/PAS domain S-box-containing protein